MLLHPVPVACDPSQVTDFSSVAPAPPVQAGCSPGKLNTLLSWLSGNEACWRSAQRHLLLELCTAAALMAPLGTWGLPAELTYGPSQLGVA